MTVHDYCESIRFMLAEIERLLEGEPDELVRDKLNKMYLEADQIVLAAKWKTAGCKAER